jgi:hypothetical protein
MQAREGGDGIVFPVCHSVLRITSVDTPEMWDCAVLRNVGSGRLRTENRAVSGDEADAGDDNAHEVFSEIAHHE